MPTKLRDSKVFNAFSSDALEDPEMRLNGDTSSHTSLGSSGIKFEVEGGEGFPGADTYIPLHRKIAILQHFSEAFRKMLYFGEIPKKFGQN